MKSGSVAGAQIGKLWFPVQARGMSFHVGIWGQSSLLCLKPVLITLQLLLQDRVTELSPQGSGTLLAALGDRGGLLSGGGAGHHSIILCGRVPFVTFVAGVADISWTVSTYHSLY